MITSRQELHIAAPLSMICHRGQEASPIMEQQNAILAARTRHQNFLVVASDSADSVARASNPIQFWRNGNRPLCLRQLPGSAVLHWRCKLGASNGLKWSCVTPSCSE